MESTQDEKRGMTTSFLTKVIFVLVLICSNGLSVSLVWGDVQYVHAADTNAVKVGESVPAFLLMGIDGKQYTVGDQGSQANEVKKPIWIHFWASWCGPCQTEAPDIVEFAGKYKGKLDVYGINATMYDNDKDVKTFVEKYKLNFPVLRDERGDIFKIFRGAALPTHIFIDGNGIVKEIAIGSLPKDKLQAKIDTIVNDNK